MRVRPAVFAQMGWYPNSRKECEMMIKEWSKNSINIKSDIKGVGGIVPHAGWFFSGEIACTVFRCLSEKLTPDTVVIFGKHLSPGSHLSIMKEGLWETPFGNIEIDNNITSKICKEYNFFIETPFRFEDDNTIELQLPFVKYFFPNAKLVSIGAPPNKDSLKLSKSIAKLCREMNISVISIGSTDLTHYGPNYGFIPAGVGSSTLEWSKENDKRVINKMIQMDPEGVIDEALKNHNACCPGAAAAAINMAKEMGAVKGEILMYATSYDKSPSSSFVGYVGIVF